MSTFFNIKLIFLVIFLLNILKATKPNLLRTISSSIITPKHLRIKGAPLTIGTHNGDFHCDEALACFMLKQLPEYENAQIFRSRNKTQLHENCDIIVDVGGEYDHERKLYDHHQKSFQETMSTLKPELGDKYNIRLCSAGLIYGFYGERIINEILKGANITLSPKDLKISFEQIYATFIIEIDAIDNGVSICTDGQKSLYKINTNLSKRVGKLNPSWEEKGLNVDVDKRFVQAMSYVGKEFSEHVLEIGGSWIKARKYVRAALQTATDIYKTGEILLLEKFCPWQHHLSSLEKEFNVQGIPKLVIYFENSESWLVAGVPITPDSYLGRKYLPVPWRGLSFEDLSSTVGIQDLTFVHHTGFIGGAKTKEAAIAMAIKSVQWNS